MNPLTNVKNIQKLNQRELELGVIGKKSWHDEYKDSAWIFIGGLPYDLTEGDIVCVFSQYGEIVNINLVRDKTTGKSKGFAFLCYEDQRSTVLAVDNLNSIKLLGRIIRVDHVHDYKKPKEHGNEDEETLRLRAEGCAPRVPGPLTVLPSDLLEAPISIRPPPAAAKDKKAKKEKKKKKKKMKVTVKVEHRSDSDSSSSESSDSEDDKKRKHRFSPMNSEKLKQEKHDIGYDRAIHGHKKYASQSEKEHDYDSSNGKHDYRNAGHRDRNGDRHRADAQHRRDRNKPSEHDRHQEDLKPDTKPVKDRYERSDNSNKGRDKEMNRDRCRHEDIKFDRRRDDRADLSHKNKDRDHDKMKDRERDYDKQRDRHRDSSRDDRRDRHPDDYNKR